MSARDRTPDPNPTADLIPLVGVRDLCASEPDEAVQWQEGLIKQLTDGEPMEIRQLNGDFLEVDLDFSLPDRNANGDGPKDPSQ